MATETLYALCLGVGLGCGILFIIWLILKLATSLECQTQNLVHGVSSGALTLIGLGLFLGLLILMGGCEGCGPSPEPSIPVQPGSIQTN